MTQEPVTTTVAVSPDVAIVADVRPGDGQVPVILLHGLSQQRRFWNPVIARLRSRPVVSIDQRAHGDTDTPVGTDVSIPTLAADVVAVLDALGIPRAVVVGHSWGAAVALAVAARHADRCAAAVLVDGGLFSPSQLGDVVEVRERLRPPLLRIPEDDLWERMGGGALGTTVSAEVRDALRPTFVRAPDGTLTTRIGVDRHMEVLDGMLAYDPAADLATTSGTGTPVWGVVCEPAGGLDPATDEWAAAKLAAVAAASALPNCRIHRWAGAVHDVPLQWPALVAGLIDTVVGGAEGGAR